MKILRLWLLVVLAVLLPVRGAVGAAMLCPSGGMGSPAQAGHPHASHHHAGHDASPSNAEGHHDGMNKCNLCCDLCSMTPMADALPSIPVPLMPASAAFPDPFVPAPSFLSDGQERPPRSR